MVCKVMLLKGNISRIDDRVSGRIIGLVCLLSERVSYENRYVSARLEFGSIIFEGGYKTQTAKRFQMRDRRLFTIELFIWGNVAQNR